MNMGESVRIEPRSAGEWVLQVRREWEGQPCLGQAVIRAAAPPDPSREPHLKLAGARAWLAAGQEWLGSHHATAAVACARHGLDELGPDYATLAAGDDTVIKLAAAEEELTAGRAENAASTMLRVLEARVHLYVEKHRDAVVE